MRRDIQYLEDILAAADQIASFLAGTDRSRLEQDSLLRSAVMHQLTVIGEAAARIGSDLRQQHPVVPWTDIAGMRNRLVHAYFAVDWDVVWVAATQEVPDLAEQVERILQTIARTESGQ